MADRDGVVSETENTVEPGYHTSKSDTKGPKGGHLLAKGEGETWLLGCFGKVHIFHSEITHGENIVRDEALHGTRTVVDFNTGSVGLVGRRGTRIIFRVKEACNGRALGAGNP